MPELPEVETVRRRLRPLVVGRTVHSAWGHPSPKFASAVEASGATITDVTRRGKYLLIALDDDRELVVHLGMTGVLRPRPDGPPDPYVRAWWALGDTALGDTALGDTALDDTALDDTVLELRDVRRFGRIAVVPAGEHASLPTLAALGPEPFDDAFTPEALWRDLRATKVRVKTRLLSQRPVAGVGNIYADEALWAAGVHPSRRGITRRQAAALHGALREVLAAGIEHGGTTLRDYRGVDGRPGEHQLHLRCYGRAGEPCERCGTELRRLVVDARGTTVCPTCQPR
ncbi:MAG TPA: bifunctional DNA-formamidopyrimidine glycosylase/DNA-(apurinic or apyrimidinic site) lyase [Acidimicrobiales bacterium]|nr:bifunctional DNA-formamidopyrimidine glycosylase/DNA-(apurinic or apyrimidinic site) lyase [Acidimicrobiales bacterium]